MIKELIFNQNKYIQATNGDEVLIAVTDGSNLEITDKRTGAGDRLESHDSFLAWAVYTDYEHRYEYHIKKFIGNPMYASGRGVRDKSLADRLIYSDMFAPDAIVVRGGKILLSHVWQALRAFTARKAVSAL